MTPRLLRNVLILSLLANVGTLGGAAYRAWGGDGFPGLPRHLGLDTEQTRRWHEAEKDFLEQLDEGAAAVRVHRDRMIRAIFSDAPDPALIDAERAAIAALQDAQQKRVIDQLLRERALLDPGQRERLAALLLAQPAGPGGFEQLHRD